MSTFFDNVRKTSPSTIPSGHFLQFLSIFDRFWNPFGPPFGIKNRIFFWTTILEATSFWHATAVTLLNALRELGGNLSLLSLSRGSGGHSQEGSWIILASKMRSETHPKKHLKIDTLKISKKMPKGFKKAPKVIKNGAKRRQRK